MHIFDKSEKLIKREADLVEQAFIRLAVSIADKHKDIDNDITYCFNCSDVYYEVTIKKEGNNGGIS